MRKRILAAGMAAALALVIVMPMVTGERTVMISDPYARETPPNAKVGGAYMTIMNHGPATRLIGVRSNAAERVQIHNHTMDASGVMRMREVEGGIALGKHETVTFAPGGLHMMLLGLVAPLRKGETLDITLELEDGLTLDVTVPVKSITAGGGLKRNQGTTEHKH